MFDNNGHWGKGLFFCIYMALDDQWIGFLIKVVDQKATICEYAIEIVSVSIYFLGEG